jgi:DDE superfamily endonuclease
MFRFDRLSRSPTAFRSLTGLRLAEFEQLLLDFVPAQDRLRSRLTTTTAGQPRERAPGAGAPHALDDRHRLLLALVWLRVYPTYEVLGFFFGMHKTNARLNVIAVLEVLQTLEDFPFDRPEGRRPRLSTPGQVMDAFPQVRLVIDSKEQRINKPRGEAKQKPYYSGKKKTHTLKTRVAVDPSGLIESVTDSQPGSTHDTTLLRGTGLLGELAKEAGAEAMLDKGYTGVKKDSHGVGLHVPKKKPRKGELTDEDRQSNRRIARYRIVVEHTMAQLNRFTVLRQVYRGREKNHKKRHTQAVRAVAALVNRRTRLCPLKRYAPAA